jgi:hypothetical protein
MTFEKNLNQAILQLAIGRFSHAADQCLAVLHSRKLLVASVVSSKDFSTMKTLYEHDFDRNAYNFISGPFGKSTNKEIICV